jgi:hypothetical protein
MCFRMTKVPLPITMKHNYQEAYYERAYLKYSLEDYKGVMAWSCLLHLPEANILMKMKNGVEATAYLPAILLRDFMEKQI